MDYRLDVTDLIRDVAKLADAPRTLEVSEDSLRKHMLKRHHDNCLKYVSKIPEIIARPDFVGRNRNINTTSFECIKRYQDNVLVAVKLDKKGDYYFVASMYEVTDAKLERMEQSKRIRRVDNPPS